MYQGCWRLESTTVPILTALRSMTPSFASPFTHRYLLGKLIKRDIQLHN